MKTKSLALVLGLFVTIVAIAANPVLADAQNISASTDESMSGNPFYFTPENGTHIANHVVTFGWYHVDNVQQYLLQVDNDSDFSSPEIETYLSESQFTSENPLPDNTYYWRVRGCGTGVDVWLWSGAAEFTVFTASSSIVDLGIPAQWQHKDTRMLCLEGCPLTGAHAWDVDHVTRGCLHCDWYCVRASISMVNSYYGGNVKRLSQDRISYYVLQERSPDAIPENDLGHGRGLYPAETTAGLSWALSGATISNPLGKPTFAQIKTWINAGQPILRRDYGSPWHATVIDGYEEDGTERVHVIDPWTGTESSVAYATLPVYEVWVGPAGATARSDEASLTQDSDGDGVIDFDEVNRFGTGTNDPDSDDDLVHDREEIRCYTFESDDSFDSDDSRKPDPDGDGLRAELDKDSDNGGTEDGIEDYNQNGRVDAGETDPLVASDDFKPITVSGRKIDYSSELGLDGWTIKLYRGGDLYATGTTSGGGYYSFTVRHPGSYSIKEVLKARWTKAAPPPQQVGDPVNDIEVDGYAFTAESGVDVTYQNFWNFKWLTVSGHKYEDTDGTHPKTDPLKDWTIELYNATHLYAETTTGTDGSYQFTVKDPGTYYIKEVLKAGWTATSPTYQVGDPSCEMEVQGYSFTAWSGQDETDKDFWNFKWLKVSGHKYDYSSGNGLQDWTIKLYMGSTLIESKTTDTTGYYEFTVKEPGTYYIKEMLKAGWTKTSPGSLVIGTDSGEMEVDGYTFAAQSGVNLADKDFTNFKWITVAGYKYEDTDGSHPITTKLSDWTIKLYKDTTEYASATTSDTGYSITVKEPGTYHIKEVLPTGWTATAPTYQVGPESGTVEVEGYSFTASSGVDVPNQDFWNFEWLKVSGYKFFDADGDGVRDKNTYAYPEPGLEHWKITLKKDGTLYSKDYTDANGYYEFTVRDPGHYTVSETLLAPWWTQTAPKPVPPGTYTFDAESGTDVEVDFGNWLEESIVTTSSYCWFDVEAGGERQFKLIFTPDVPDNPTLFRLTASNPGQFYYNVFYVGTLTAGQTFNITLPYPFITQGAVPVHVYSSLNTGPTGCLIPGNDITYLFDITPPNGIITLDGSYNEFEKTANITVHLKEGSYSGFVYITVHLDYGLKKDAPYIKDSPSPGDANKTTTTTTIIHNLDSYQFSVSGPVIDTQTVENLNVFKRDPGFGGLVTDSFGNPVKGVRVQIYGPDGKLIATVYTDEDGWYQYNYKYTGKPATFTIKLPDYGQQKSVTLKANSFVVVNFQIP